MCVFFIPSLASLPFCVRSFDVGVMFRFDALARGGASWVLKFEEEAEE